MRESRNTSIEEMAVATGIGQSYLEAVERDEIHLLPGKAFGKLYIRAYAEVFEFDPQPWIDDYDREQRAAAASSTEPASPVPSGARPVAAAIARWKESRAAAEKAERAGEPVVEAQDFAEAEEATDVETIETIETVDAVDSVEPIVLVPAAKRPITAFVVIGVVVVASAIYFVMHRTSGDKNPAPATERQVDVRSVAEVPPPAPSPRETPRPAVAEPMPTPSAKPFAVRDTPSDALTVPESGVGRRIVNSRLEGESTEFAAGEVACFQTRVVGGQRGDAIRHVWIYDGRAQQSITLRLGGPDWRTHTKKTLYKTGPWTVEARDGSGRVLATASFACVPAGR
jgi:transcriptional regulator with XRE-family HTH domain